MIACRYVVLRAGATRSMNFPLVKAAQTPPGATNARQPASHYITLKVVGRLFSFRSNSAIFLRQQ